MSRLLVLGALCLTGCPPAPMEAHDAADALRANPHRIGTVSRQELESDVTDPDSTVGTAAKPAPVTSNTTVKVIGMVQSKICFLVEDTNIDARDETEKTASYRQKMNSARYAAISLCAGSSTVYGAPGVASIVIASSPALPSPFVVLVSKPMRPHAASAITTATERTTRSYQQPRTTSGASPG